MDLSWDYKHIDCMFSTKFKFWNFIELSQYYPIVLLDCQMVVRVGMGLDPVPHQTL